MHNSKSIQIKYVLFSLLITTIAISSFPQLAGALEPSGDPCIELSKTGPTTAMPGDTITYEFRVKNCGSMHFASGIAWVDDPMFGSEPLWIGELYIGNSRMFTRDYLVKESDCGALLNTAVAYGSWDEDRSTYDAVHSASWAVSVVCEYQGCTPGYWKQEQHFDSWMDYAPGELFSTVFGNDAFPGMTLLQVLEEGGGDINALGRHAVAALLNASSADVSADRSAADVIAMFNEAYASGDDEKIEEFKDLLNESNEQGCPLD